MHHTYAIILLEANEHPKVIQDILCHSDIKMTLNLIAMLCHILNGLRTKT
nr:hypothetical protein [Clostridium intestinale]